MPILTNSWKFVIPSIPGDNGVGSAAMAAQIQDISEPYGFSIKNVGVTMGKFIYNFAGALVLDQDLDITFYETVSGRITNTLQNWRDNTVQYNTNLPYAKSIYATTGFLYIMGVNQNVAMQLTYNNLQLRDFKSEKMVQNSGTNETWKITVKLKYDFLTNPITII